VTVANGAKLFSQEGYVAASAGSVGVMNVTGSGSTWSLSDNLFVSGNYFTSGGTAVLGIAAGGSVSDVNSWLSQFAGSNAAVTVSGSGSTWSTVQNVYVGGNSGTFGGTATVSVNSGGTLTAGDTLKLWNHGSLSLDTGGAVIATNFDATTGTFNFNGGTLTVSGGTYTQSSGPLTIDGTNHPTLVFAGGATLSGVTSVTIGATNSGVFEIMSGTNATFSGQSFFGSASGSVGSLTVSGSGSSLNTSTVVLGYSSGSTGAATVTGTGAAWSNSQQIIVGVSGSGALNIVGGTVTASNVYVGSLSGGFGAVTLSGSGSALAGLNNLFVGNLGTGSLSISNGATVYSTTGSLGLMSGSSGTVTVSGAGSAWNNSGNLYVGGTHGGSGGTGSLAVNNSATLTVGGTLKLWQQGTLTLDTGGAITTRNFDATTGTFNFNGGALTVSSGTYTQATGNLTINGSTATASPTMNLVNATTSGISSIIVGNSTQGVLGLYAGTTISVNTTLTLGALAGSLGTLNISGSGSILSASQNVVIGGSGMLSVAHGGALNQHLGSLGLMLGNNAGLSEVLNVSDAGSTVTATQVVIGNNGSGLMTVTNGAALVDSYGDTMKIGSAAGSTGALVISGTGSGANIGSLEVGDYGNGSLTLNNAATLSTWDLGNDCLCANKGLAAPLLPDQPRRFDVPQTASVTWLGVCCRCKLTCRTGRTSGRAISHS
jgi:T5SS/PEP-CTERM-associated repeat protein